MYNTSTDFSYVSNIYWYKMNKNINKHTTIVLSVQVGACPSHAATGLQGTYSPVLPVVPLPLLLAYSVIYISSVSVTG